MDKATRAIWLTEAEWDVVSQAILTILNWKKDFSVYDGRVLKVMESAHRKIEQANKGVS